MPGYFVVNLAAGGFVRRAAYQVDDKVVDAAMAGGLDLRNVLQLIQHCLDDGALA
jgi:hypothetical protein